MAKKVVGDTVGLPIHYFVAVDFESFKKIVDILEGTMPAFDNRDLKYLRN